MFTPGIILQEVVEAKNATDIPEKTNVTEETIENIVLPEKVRHCRLNDPPHTMFSGCSRERALILPRHCIPSLHSHPHHLHDPRHASGLFSFDDIILPTLWRFWSQIKFHYLPESLAIVFLGAVLGLLMTALPEAETKRVCFIMLIIHWELTSFLPSDSLPDF